MRNHWLGRAAASWRRLVRDRRGSIAPVFGLMIVPLVVAGGLAVDVGRAVSGRNDLQDAVDSTTLALAHLPASTPLTTLQADATTWLGADAQNKNLGNLTVTVTPATSQLTVS